MGASVFQMYTYELKTGIYMVWFIARAVQAQNTNEESLYFNSFEHLGPKVCTLTFPKQVPVAGTFVGNVKVKNRAWFFWETLKYKIGALHVRKS